MDTSPYFVIQPHIFVSSRGKRNVTQAVEPLYMEGTKVSCSTLEVPAEDLFIDLPSLSGVRETLNKALLLYLSMQASRPELCLYTQSVEHDFLLPFG